MENLVVVWYLMLVAPNRAWTIPTPYPTEEICREVGKKYFDQDSAFRSAFCIPAPVFRPIGYPNDMFVRKDE